MAETETLRNPAWTLGERLEKARSHARITRPQMAERLGVSERTIRNYENETVHVTRLIVLAYSAETGVPIGWLTDDDPGLRSRCFSHLLGINQLELFANGQLAASAA